MSATQSLPQATSRLQILIATLSIGAIGTHLILRFRVRPSAEHFGLALYDLPLVVALLLGGAPLVFELFVKFIHREFGSDLLAGISIVTAALLHEYLAGVFVVLMLSSGEALEAYAVRSASSVLEALSRRMPTVAHRRQDGEIRDIGLDEVRIGAPC
jgi:cation transport ATPase